MTVCRIWWSCTTPACPTAQDALDRLLSPLHEVSCHYLVTEDGRIIQMVPERLRAWHAGEGNWGGEDDVNSSSIGIEIVNPGHDYGYPEFPRRQIAAVDRAVPKHLAAARDSRRSHSGAFRRRPFAQTRSGREISLGGAAPFRRRALGGAGTDRVRTGIRSRRQRQRGTELSDGVAAITAMAFRLTAYSIRSPTTWCLRSSVISVQRGATARWIPRR